MSDLRVLSAAEQVAVHLSNEIQSGRWSKMMPGSDRLAGDLGVGPNTAEAALRLLEERGVLRNRGRRRGREILATRQSAKKNLKVSILLYEKGDINIGYFTELHHGLMRLGYSVDFASKSLHDLGLKKERVARYVEKNPADAWIVVGGTIDVLQWFLDAGIPAFAMFGRSSTLDIPSVSVLKIPVMQELVDQLVELGHSRIVFLTRHERLVPTLALFERSFLNHLKSHDIETSYYNLPLWDNNWQSFHRCLYSLFSHTPPTALIVDETRFFIAALNHLTRRGIRAPEDVSLICTDYDPSFDWTDPVVSHMSWNPSHAVRRVIQWVNNVASGREDRKRTKVKAELVKGGTIGSVNYALNKRIQAGMRILPPP